MFGINLADGSQHRRRKETVRPVWNRDDQFRGVEHEALILDDGILDGILGDTNPATSGSIIEVGEKLERGS